MRITNEQEQILNSLICERLSADNENKILIENFVSKRGSSLVKYLRKQGLVEEQEGKTAYYVIKTPNKDVLMFFSIKCGAVFEPLLDEVEVKHDFQRLLILLQAIANANGEVPELDEANDLLLKYQVGDRISAYDYITLMNKAQNKKNYLGQLFDDKERETNDNIFRVMSTHSGIELVHFCTNDAMRSKWKEYGFAHPMGETLFWKFIAPKFFDIQQIAGCEYAFLFAADLSEDESLVNYYDVSLKFKKRFDVGTNKPFYDFCCEFMCQTISDMKKNREYFFENFNISEDDIVI